MFDGPFDVLRQELIARTHHRGTIRKCLYPAFLQKKSNNEGMRDWECKHLDFSSSSQIFPPSITQYLNLDDSPFHTIPHGSKIVNSNKNKTVGSLYSKSLNVALAQIRIEHIDDCRHFVVGDFDEIMVQPYLPPWWQGHPQT